MKEVMVLLGAYFVGGLIHNVLYWLWHLVPEEDWSLDGRRWPREES